MRFHPGCTLVLLLCLGAPGCFTEVSLPPVQAVNVTTSPVSLPAHVPVGAPQVVQIPGPPPPPRAESAQTCEDDEATVGGYWDFFGEWSWINGFCAQIPPGHAYVAPSYQEGRYVRGHFATSREAGRWRPSNVRLVHPPGLVLNEPHRRPAPPRPAPAPLQAPAMPAYVVGPQPLPQAQVGVPWLPAQPGDPAAARAPAPVQDDKPRGPTLEQCLSKARSRYPGCVQILGGELRVR